MNRSFCRLDSNNQSSDSDARPESGRIPIYVEVVRRPGTSKGSPSDGELKDLVRSHLESLVCVPYGDSVIHPAHMSKLSTVRGSVMSSVLESNVESISICDSGEKAWREADFRSVAQWLSFEFKLTDHSVLTYGTMTLFWQWDLVVFLFQLNEEGPEEDVEEGEAEGQEGQGQASMYREYSLPSREFHGLWDSLYYEEDSGQSPQGQRAGASCSVNDSNKPANDHEAKSGKAAKGPEDHKLKGNVKSRLLRYASSALVFSQRGVRAEICSLNRVVLLHGPPGTGKTSLCLALAQKLSIRFGARYPAGSQLIEVNAHSLFSKYFSESGKLVGRLFSRITELVEDGGGQSLVFVLIDEVESLTAARKSGGNEPTDALRAVNSLLTQLDQLKRFPNVLVLSTSNLSGAIDAAFLDRADIRAYIGPPSIRVRYTILASALLELERTGIVSATSSPRSLNHEPKPDCDVSMTSVDHEVVSKEGHREKNPHEPPKLSDLLLPVDLLRGMPQHMTPEVTEEQGTHGMKQQRAVQSLLSDTGGVTVTREVQGGLRQGLMDLEEGPTDAAAMSWSIWEVAAACEGMSCRLLRKLPFLAHASAVEMPEPCPAFRFIREMKAAAAREWEERELGRG